MIRELIFANRHSDGEKLKIVEKLLLDLRATWAEAIDSQTRAKLTADQRDTKSTATTEVIPEDDYIPFSISR